MEYKIEFHTPKESVDAIREALIESGVGKLGNYDSIMAVSEIVGYWRPLPGSNPKDGVVGDVNRGTIIKMIK